MDMRKNVLHFIGTSSQLFMIGIGFNLAALNINYLKMEGVTNANVL